MKILYTPSILFILISAPSSVATPTRTFEVCQNAHAGFMRSQCYLVFFHVKGVDVSTNTSPIAA